MNRLASAFCALVFLNLTACETLMTRDDVRGADQTRQRPPDPMTTLQRSTADMNNRVSELESELRQVNGRVEAVENRLSQNAREREKLSSNSEQSNAENTKRIQILQDEVAKMHEQVGILTAELNTMKAAAAAAPTAAAAEEPAAKKGSFDIAEEHFENKEWRKAILNYQKFRDSNAKSKKFPEATYKIGVSFQELGMKDEAKTFYDEVIAKFSGSPEAKKAKSRLKSLKK